MLRLRLIFGFLLAGLVIGLLLLDAYLTTLTPPIWTLPGLGLEAGRWLFNGAICAALLAVLVWLGAREVLRLAESLGHRPRRWVAQGGAVALVLVPYVLFNAAPAGCAGGGWEVFLLVLLLGLAFLSQAVRHGTAGVLANLATTLLIVLYVGGLAYFLARLRMEVGGTTGVALLLFSVFVVKMTDVGAYFTGRSLGRHKMAAWLSPHKTWEGLVGGVIVAAGCALGIGHALHVGGFVLVGSDGAGYALTLLAFGLLMAFLSVAGDLCASLLKRDAAVKDSGEALPGFGGILDVLDSPLLAAPGAWLFWTHLV